MLEYMQRNVHICLYCNCIFMYHSSCWLFSQCHTIFIKKITIFIYFIEKTIFIYILAIKDIVVSCLKISFFLTRMHKTPSSKSRNLLCKWHSSEMHRPVENKSFYNCKTFQNNFFSIQNTLRMLPFCKDNPITVR